MNVIATDKNKITLIYNSEASLGKQMKGYVKAAKKEVLEIDISKTSLTGTQWAEIAEELQISIGDLVNTDHPDFLNTYEKDVSLDDHDWIKVLDNHPKVLHGSILIIGDTYKHLTNPSDFTKYIEADSAGISRNPAE